MTKQERLWSRYWGIRDNHKNGFAFPIIRHLALRRDPLAMVELGATLDKRGRIADPYSQEGLAYRAFRRGHLIGAQHLAMNAFNSSDLAGYRHWLGRAARAGDGDAAKELRRFEVRLPHEDAGRIRRKRPLRRSDFL